MLEAKAVVNEFTNKFAAWFLSLDLATVISKLNKMALDLAQNHAARYAKEFAKDNGNNLEERLEVFAESLAKKLLHSPISFLRQEGNAEPTTEQFQAADLINKIFLSKSKEPRK
ncbi:Glutamyl-tRNA reductase [subsurface metagenome]